MSDFAYAGIDSKTRELALELEALGGGDATLGTFEVHAVIDDRSTADDRGNKDVHGLYKHEARTLWIHGKTIGIRDATKPRSRPSAEVMTYTDVTSSMRLQGALQDRNALLNKSSAAVDWVLHGYNACLIGYGPREVGKSLFFFGAHNSKEPPSVEYVRPSLCGAVLRQLYDRAGLARKSPAPHLRGLDQTSYGQASDRSRSPERKRPEGITGFNSGAPAPQVTIAISCWCVRGNQVLDLCLDSESETQQHNQGGIPSAMGSGEYAAIDCVTLEDALLVVHTARSKAAANGALAMTQAVREGAPESGRCHFFTRIIVHRPAPNDLEGRVTVPEGEPLLSHLHLVDLIGKQESSHDLLYADKTQHHHHTHRDTAQDGQIARREINLQLGAFTGVLQQMKSRHGQHSDKGAVVTKARDSRLTSVLAPLVQGNCKTILFAFLQDGEQHYRSAHSLLKLCDGLTEVANPCHRVSGVPRGALPLRSVLTVLPPPGRTDDDIFYSSSMQGRSTRALSSSNPSSPTRGRGGEASPPYKDNNNNNTQSSSPSGDDSVLEFGDINLSNLADGSPRAYRNSAPPSRGGGNNDADVSSFSLRSPSEGSSEEEHVGLGGYGYTNNSTAAAAAAFSSTQSGSSTNGGSYAPTAALHNIQRVDKTMDKFRELMASSSGSSIGGGGGGGGKDEDFRYDPSGERKHREESLLAGIKASQVEHDHYLAYMRDVNAKQSATATAEISAVAMLSASGHNASTRPFSVSFAEDVPPMSPEPVARPALPLPTLAPSAEDTAKYLRYLSGESSNVSALNEAATVQDGAVEKDDTVTQKQQRSVRYQAHNGDNFVKQLESIYLLYCPEKAEKAAEIAKVFDGRENLLLEELHHKYDIQDEHLELFEAHTEGSHMHRKSVKRMEVARDTGEVAAPIALIPTEQQKSGYNTSTNEQQAAKSASSSATNSPVDTRTRTLRGIQSTLDAYRNPDGSLAIGSSDSTDSGDVALNFNSEPLVKDGKFNPTANSSSPPGSDRVKGGDSGSLSALKLSSFGMKALSLTRLTQAQKTPSKDKNDGAAEGTGKKAVFASSTGVASPEQSADASLLDLADPNTVILSPKKEEESILGSGSGSGSDSDGNNNSKGHSSASMSPSTVVQTSATETTQMLLANANMNEVDLLRRNTATLMEAVNEERAARMRAENSLAQLQQSCTEEIAKKDLEVEDKKLDIVRLSGQLRTLVSKRPDLEDAYTVFEAHVGRYQKEAESLRTELAVTQLEVMDMLEGASPLPKGKGNSNNNGGVGAEEEKRDSVNNNMSAADVHDSVFEAAIQGNRDAAAAVSESVFAAATRATAAKASYRKLQHENQQLWKELESLRASERRFEVGQRISAESNRRLRDSLNEVSVLKQTICEQKEAARVKEADYRALLQDTADMRASEANLRTERARIMEDLSVMRSRVRELDEERQRLSSINAYSATTASQPTPDLLSTEGSGRLAGGASGAYNRREEGGVGSPSLEKAIADLHEQLVALQPTLLPLLRALGNEVYFERTRHLEHRAELLRHVYPADSKNSSSSSGLSSSGLSPPRTKKGGLQPPQPGYLDGVRGSRGATTGSVSGFTYRKPVVTQQQQDQLQQAASGNAFDHMASFQAAKARRRAADQIKTDRVRQGMKSDRVPWESVG